MAELLDLSSIFDKKIFRIPDYQRGYAWNERQLEDFWDDCPLMPVANRLAEYEDAEEKIEDDGK